MTAAPPDLHSALRAMADEARAAAPDLTDAAVRRATGRRRRRVVGSLVVAAGLAVGVPLTVGQIDAHRSRGLDPAGPISGTSTYDPTVEVPWPWLRDLPRQLDEPLALTYNLNDEDSGYRFRAVSASGRQWEVPGSGGDAPTISRDGRQIAWFDAVAEDLVIRDLRAGTEHRVDMAPGLDGSDRWALQAQTPMSWSPDGRLLAVNVYWSTEPPGDALDPDFRPLLVDARSGALTELAQSAVAVGWGDGEHLLALQASPGARTIRLLSVEVSTATSVVVGSVDGATIGGINQCAAIHSGAQVVCAAESEAEGVVVIATDPAAFESTAVPIDCVTCSLFHPTVVLGQAVLLGDRPLNGVQRILAVELAADGGAVRYPVVTFSPRFPEVSSVSVAIDVLDSGASGRPHLATWWPGWYLDWISYTIVALAVLGWLVLRARRSPGQIGRRP